MAMEVLALDIDDVAVRHVEGFVRWSNETFGTKLTVDDYTEIWAEVWGVDAEEVERRKKLFFTDEIVGSFENIDGASEGIMALAGIKRIIGVTARRESLRPITEMALELIAPGSVSDVKFATYYKDGQKITRPKTEICLEIGAKHLIDDQLKHCLAVAKVGIDSLLFGDYAWNRKPEELPSRITRVRNWPEVLQYFGLQSR